MWFPPWLSGLGPLLWLLSTYQNPMLTWPRQEVKQSTVLAKAGSGKGLPKVRGGGERGGSAEAPWGASRRK